MFECSQFKDNFSLFQQLVADGVFETLSQSSSSSSKPEEFKRLAKLALSDPNKSLLLESYYMLKVLFGIYSLLANKYFRILAHVKSLHQEQRKVTEDSAITTSRVSNSNRLVTVERPCESLNQNFSGQFKSPSSNA